ncbi:MAG: GNAT family N-acetyltransferase [Pseudomonadales bacterium]|jgi:ribosomal protein S18 acetylase RimI-like enzyme|nr:GNAT family N-acetyltransferase [Pseudomonadales bacterium]
MPPRLVIRPARPADLAALAALETRSFTGERLSPARFQHWCGADNGLLLVAAERRASAPPLGYALSFWRRQGVSARLYSIAIAAEARGQGLAQRLLQASERQLKQRGRSRYTLEVAVRNAAAIALYQKRGFIPFGRYRAYYQDGQDALRMYKPL